VGIQEKVNIGTGKVGLQPGGVASKRLERENKDRPDHFNFWGASIPFGGRNHWKATKIWKTTPQPLNE